VASASRYLNEIVNRYTFRGRQGCGFNGPLFLEQSFDPNPKPLDDCFHTSLISRRITSAIVVFLRNASRRRMPCSFL
jgi:hypothetical protein